MQQNHYTRAFDDVIYEGVLRGEITDKGTKRKREEVINQPKTMHINKHTHTNTHSVISQCRFKHESLV